MPSTILVVDDEKNIVQLARLYLNNEGFHVEAAYDGRQALEKARTVRPDLIVLDIMMPEVDGLTVCKELRKSSNVPIIILTARGDDVDRIVGLELGADDYISKPFNPRELIARVEAILRRRRALPAPAAPEQRLPFRFGRFALDFQSRTLSADNRSIILSATEFALLKVFVNHAMRTLTRERLIGLLYGPEGEHTDRGVDVQVWRLRQILEANPSAPRLIQTVRGRGYVFVPDGEHHAQAQPSAMV